MLNQQISKDSLQNPYQEFTFVIPASGRQRIDYAAKYFRVLSLSANTLSVSFAGAGTASNIVGAGIGIEHSQPIPYHELSNTGGSSITVTVALSMGEISDSRFVASSAIAIATKTQLITTADVAVLTTATTKVCSTRAGRQTVIISNLALNNTSIRVGDISTGATRGSEVPIGGTYTADTSADIYVYNPAGGTINIGVAEVVN